MALTRFLNQPYIITCSEPKIIWNFTYQNEYEWFILDNHYVLHCCNHPHNQGNIFNCIYHIIFIISYIIKVNDNILHNSQLRERCDLYNMLATYLKFFSDFHFWNNPDLSDFTYKCNFPVNYLRDWLKHFKCVCVVNFSVVKAHRGHRRSHDMVPYWPGEEKYKPFQLSEQRNDRNRKSSLTWINWRSSTSNDQL